MIKQKIKGGDHGNVEDASTEGFCFFLLEGGAGFFPLNVSLTFTRVATTFVSFLFFFALL